MKFLKQKQWGWLAGGFILGLTFLSAVWAIKPIGVSTQFVIFDAIVWDKVSSDLITEDANAKSGYTSENAYLNKSGGKYAKNTVNPLNYSFVFVLAMILGGYLAYLTSKNTKDEGQTKTPKYEYKQGNSKARNYSMAFFGGVLVLIGARLAGGCTSGHMMSGIMQTSLSGYLFALSAFPLAIITALILYKRSK